MVNFLKQLISREISEQDLFLVTLRIVCYKKKKRSIAVEIADTEKKILSLPVTNCNWGRQMILLKKYIIPSVLPLSLCSNLLPFSLLATSLRVP